MALLERNENLFMLLFETITPCGIKNQNLRRPEEQNLKEQEENKTGPEDFINVSWY